MEKQELYKFYRLASEEDLLKFLQIYRAANDQQDKANQTMALAIEIVKKYLK